MLKIGNGGKTVKSEYFLDDAENTLVVKYSGDVSPIINENIAAQNDWQGFDKKADFHHVAEIPNEIVVKFMVEKGVNILAMNQEGLEDVCKRILNDPEYKYLKRIPVRI